MRFQISIDVDVRMNKTHPGHVHEDISCDDAVALLSKLPVLIWVLWIIVYSVPLEW